MVTSSLFLRFGVALGIGILVGLQREYAEYSVDKNRADMFAGVRTFALLGLLGCSAAYLADITGSMWLLIVVSLVVGTLITGAYLIISWRTKEVGLTTEVAAILTLLTGALAYWDQITMAAAIGVATTVLLALKFELRTLVTQITREDIYATLRFAVITVIILPILPKQGLGSAPFDVLNPYKIWLMVVLISGISFLGYVLNKLVGARQGIGLTGLLGGLTSSTAVTMSFSQRSQIQTQLAKPFALAVIVAWTMMFPRVLVEVRIVNPALLPVLWPPIVAAGVAGLLYSAYLYFLQRPEKDEEVSFTNPFELGPAIQFGLMYAVILLISRVVELSTLGSGGIYLSSIVSGLVDVDAITLSMAQLSSVPGGLDLKVAERAIVLAAMSNTAVKGGIVVFTGSAALRKTLLPGFILILVVGIGVAFLL
jgi:uncharacterized membrane protein (DUF4010 family)